MEETEVKIVNKVAASGLVTFDLADLFDSAPVRIFDLKDNLFQGLLLKEKDFREFLKDHDWSFYQGCLVAVYCSADAIIPTWAYMLLGSKLQPFAKKIVFGTQEHLQEVIFHDRLMELDLEQFKDKKIVVKGCGSIYVPDSAYLEIAVLLKPVVKSLMFGEPCSTVPVFKNS